MKWNLFFIDDNSHLSRINKENKKYVIITGFEHLQGCFLRLQNIYIDRKVNISKQCADGRTNLIKTG